jgi:UDP-glucose 4-epimerase
MPGDRPVHVPSAVVGAAMSAARHICPQQVGTRRLDMGFAVAMTEPTGARPDLGWAPTKNGTDVEVVEA